MLVGELVCGERARADLTTEVGQGLNSWGFGLDVHILYGLSYSHIFVADSRSPAVTSCLKWPKAVFDTHSITTVLLYSTSSKVSSAKLG
jgi:hypothetical protein